MAKREIELYLERSLNKARKEVFGKGALIVNARIMNNVIFVMMDQDISSYGPSKEQMFLLMVEHGLEEIYYNSINEACKAAVEKVLKPICDLQIKKLHIKVDMENGYSFSTIVLDGNLENLIESGDVTKPTKLK